MINLVIVAVMYAIIVYMIAYIKKVSLNAENVTIRYIAKAVIATNIGQFNIFCNTIDNKIVATGSAKNNNKLFIILHPFLGKFFGAIALIFFILGLVVGIPVLVEFFNTHFITKVPSAILATGFMGLAAIAFQCAIILDTITRQHRENYELNLLRYEQIENLKK